MSSARRGRAFDAGSAGTLCLPVKSTSTGSSAFLKRSREGRHRDSEDCCLRGPASRTYGSGIGFILRLRASRGRRKRWYWRPPRVRAMPSCPGSRGTPNGRGRYPPHVAGKDEASRPCDGGLRRGDGCGERLGSHNGPGHGFRDASGRGVDGPQWRTDATKDLSGAKGLTRPRSKS